MIIGMFFFFLIMLIGLWFVEETKIGKKWIDKQIKDFFELWF